MATVRILNGFTPAMEPETYPIISVVLLYQL